MCSPPTIGAIRHSIPRHLQFANRTLGDVKMLRRIDEVAALMEALEKLPGGNPLKDNPAYQTVATTLYSRSANHFDNTSGTSSRLWWQ